MWVVVALAAILISGIVVTTATLIEIIRSRKQYNKVEAKVINCFESKSTIKQKEGIPGKIYYNHTLQYDYNGETKTIVDPIDYIMPVANNENITIYINKQDSTEIKFGDSYKRVIQTGIMLIFIAFIGIAMCLYSV